MGAHHLPGEVIEVALRTPWSDVRKPYQVLTEPEIAAILELPNARDRALLAVISEAASGSRRRSPWTSLTS